MKRTAWLQETRKVRFEEALTGWRGKRLTQAEAVRLRRVCERAFRRYVDRDEDEGLDELADKRLEQVSALRAPVDEMVRLEALYRERYDGWNIKHSHSFYRRCHGGTRSYSWVKKKLQEREVVAKARGRGRHRKRRARAPLPGMMIHQDGSTHAWVPGHYWDLIVTMDDATSERYSMFFVAQEGTAGGAHVCHPWNDFGLAEYLSRRRAAQVARQNDPVQTHHPRGSPGGAGSGRAGELRGVHDQCLLPATSADRFK